MSLDAALLAQQLSQLGRDLDTEVAKLGELEQESVEMEGAYRHLQELHEDDTARAFLQSRGSNAEARKAEARLMAVESRLRAQQAYLDWNRKKAELRVQQASLQALHRRCEIGRSLLSREKSLMNLENSGVSV